MRLLIAPKLTSLFLFLQTKQLIYSGSQAGKTLETLEKCLLMLATTTVQIILRIQKQVSQSKTFSRKLEFTYDMHDQFTMKSFSNIVHNKRLNHTFLSSITSVSKETTKKVCVFLQVKTITVPRTLSCTNTKHWITKNPFNKSESDHYSSSIC